jgi:hypothetical protein
MIDVRRSILLGVAAERRRMHAELNRTRDEFAAELMALRHELAEAKAELHRLCLLCARSRAERAEMERVNAQLGSVRCC